MKRLIPLAVAAAISSSAFAQIPPQMPGQPGMQHDAMSQMQTQGGAATNKTIQDNEQRAQGRDPQASRNCYNAPPTWGEATPLVGNPNFPGVPNPSGLGPCNEKPVSSKR